MAIAQDVQTDPTGREAPVQVAGLYTGDDGPVLLGRDKVAPLCPEFCAPRRVTAPEQATVGERDVLAYTLASATTGSKLHVDSRRSLWAQAEKFPRTASPEDMPNMVTQKEFRPALDPVLAEPTTNNTE